MVPFWRRDATRGISVTEPFLEHPTGDYVTALEALEAAIRKLRALPEWKNWITFCAQGEGATGESVHFAEVRLLQDKLDAGGPLNLAEIIAFADVAARSLVPEGTLYSIAAATPEEAARLLDAIFRSHLGIHPFPDEADDYSVGAEWL
jgi:hypothetical protein